MPVVEIVGPAPSTYTRVARMVCEEKQIPYELKQSPPHSPDVDAIVCHYTLAIMTTAGLYEISGDWLYDIGLPGKSGISGGIVTVSPGDAGLGTLAPLGRRGKQRKGAACRQVQSIGYAGVIVS